MIGRMTAPGIINNTGYSYNYRYKATAKKRAPLVMISSAAAG